MDFEHTPVLLQEVISFLPKSPGVIADFTVGGANHSAEILKAKQNATLVGIDRDKAAINAASIRLKPYSGRFELIHSSISDATLAFIEKGKQFDFVLADLGVSSHQIGTGKRGFSFRKDGPLDMRMNQNDPLSASQLIQTIQENELARIIKKYGEEIFAKKIAKCIVKRREERKIETTKDLADCVLNAIPKKFHFGKIHPATKTFQAIRIYLNKELDELHLLLTHGLDLLKKGGRIAIISFHSLEDRPVKQTFKRWEDPCTCPKSIPVCVCGKKAEAFRVTKRAVTASASEMDSNFRSRSARLRVVEKL